MLRVTRLTDRTGRYYVATTADERFPAGPGRGAGSADRAGPGARAARAGPPEHPSRKGRWCGDGAPALGLGDQVEPEPLARLLSGCHPSTGRPLRLREARVSGVDLTFAAPKSVSVLFALGDAEQARVILDSHDAAVDGALAYVEARALGVRRRDRDGRRLERVRALTGAAFTHRLSRALDPHLHTHVVVANVAQGEDGRWSALDWRGAFAHARAAGAVYDAHLRHLISERLGLAWSPRVGGYGLAAVDPVLVGAFSSRSAEIRAHVEARRGGALRRDVTARERAVAWALTRDERRPDVSADLIAGRWRAVVRDAGFSSPSELGAALGKARREGASREAGVGGPLDEHRFAAALHEWSSDGAARRDVVAAWAGALASGAPREAVDACVESLATWGEGIGVAERRSPLRPLVASQRALRALGPRPSRPDALAHWRAGADAIERYRSDGAVAGGCDALGVPGRAVEDDVQAARRLPPGRAGGRRRSQAPRTHHGARRGLRARPGGGGRERGRERRVPCARQVRGRRSVRPLSGSWRRGSRDRAFSAIGPG